MLPMLRLFQGLTAGLSLQSLAACEAWKQLYCDTKAKVAASAAPDWEFDDGQVFAQTNAFMQRCRSVAQCRQMLVSTPDHMLLSRVLPVQTLEALMHVRIQRI